MRSLGLPQTDSLELLFNRWNEVVGADLASNCRPARLDRGCLTIEAKDHLWATELRWMKSAVVERCSAALGAGVVTSVRIGISKG